VADDMKRRQTIDPAVAGLLSNFEERQADAHLPAKERKKKAKERKKIRARRERRVTYDLPPSLKQRIAELAEQHRVPASQIAALLLDHGLKALESGAIDLDEHKIESRTPRYDANLDLGHVGG
jgi:hypothetical protein